MYELKNTFKMYKIHQKYRGGKFHHDLTHIHCAHFNICLQNNCKHGFLLQALGDSSPNLYSTFGRRHSTIYTIRYQSARKQFMKEKECYMQSPRNQNKTLDTE